MTTTTTGYYVAPPSRIDRSTDNSLNQPIDNNDQRFIRSLRTNQWPR